MADPVFQADAQTLSYPPTTAPPASQPPSLQSTVDPDAKVKSDLLALDKQKVAADRGIAGQEIGALTQDKARAQRAYDAEGVTIDEIGKQSWNADQEMQKREHSPMENFGSLGSIIAIAASAFTHTSAISAFNAAGAYNEAVKNNDNEAYNKAFAGFKENAQLMIKRAGLEHERYEDAFKMAGMDISIAQAKTRAAAASFNDKKALIFDDAGMFPELMQYKDQMNTAAVKLTEDLVKIERGNAMLNYVYENSVKRDEKGEVVKGKDGKPIQDPQKQSQAVIDFEKKEAEAKYAGHSRASGTATQEKEINRRALEMVEANPGMTYTEAYDIAAPQVKADHATPFSSAQRQKLESHIGQYDDAAGIIDGLEKTLETHVGAAGIAGKANRLRERAGNLLGNGSTDYEQFERDVAQLQFMATNLLLDQNRRPLSAEHGEIAKIIAGLNLGDTTANTLRAMRTIRDRLKVIRDRNAAELGAKATFGGTPAAPAEPKHNWDEFPDRQ